MELRQIKFFLSVANQLNFTNAARECYISQQALSQQISLMEKELGFSLFTRNNRQVTLTSAGSVFLEEAKHISALYDKGVERSRAAATGLLGSLCVGYAFHFHHVFFSYEMLIDFIKANDQIFLTAEKEDNPLLLQHLLDSTLDIAIIDKKYVDGYEDNIEYMVVGETPITVFLSAANPLAAGEGITLQQLESNRLILCNTSQRFIDEFAGKYDIKLNNIQWVSNLATQIMLTSANKGITLLPFSTLHAIMMSKYIITRPLIGIEENAVACAAWRKDNANPVLPFFIKTVSDELAKMANDCTP